MLLGILPTDALLQQHRLMEYSAMAKVRRRLGTGLWRDGSHRTV